MTTDDLNDSEVRITITGTTKYNDLDPSVPSHTQTISSNWSLYANGDISTSHTAAEDLFGLSLVPDDNHDLLYTPPTDDDSSVGTISSAAVPGLIRQFQPFTDVPFMVGAKDQVVPGKLGELRDLRVSDSAVESPPLGSPVVTPPVTVTTSTSTTEAVSPLPSPLSAEVFTPATTPGTPITPISPDDVSPVVSPPGASKITIIKTEETSYFPVQA
jgi:hypothetical protein